MSGVERGWVVGRVDRVRGKTNPQMTLVTDDGQTLRGRVPTALHADLARLPGHWVEFRAELRSGRWRHPSEARLLPGPVPGGAR